MTVCLYLVELNLIASKNPLTHKYQKTSFDTHASIQTALLPTEYRIDETGTERPSSTNYIMLAEKQQLVMQR